MDHPERLWLLLLLLPVLWLGWRGMTAVEPGRRYLALALRAVVLVVLVLMLCGVQGVRTHEDLSVVAVLDRSESAARFAEPPAGWEGAPELEAWVGDYLSDAAGDMRPDDRWGLVAFDGRPWIRTRGDREVGLPENVLSRPVEGTDAAAAIRQALASNPDANTALRLVLFWDGNETNGDALAAAYEAAAAGVLIDVVPLSYEVRDEVMVERMQVRTEANEGQTVRVTTVLRATRPMDGSVQVTHDGRVLNFGGETGGVPVSRADWTIEEAADLSTREAGRYVAQVRVDVPMTGSGLHTFDAQFVPGEGADTIASNNRAEGFTLVRGQGRVLFVDGLGGDAGRVLSQRLAAHDLSIDVVGVESLGASLTALQRYDAVILQDVSADLVPGSRQRALAAYVQDLGGGLLMLGGPKSFGAGGWTNSPVDEILPVMCQIPSQTILPSGALVLVIDRSGSMGAPVGGTNRTQQDVANEAAVQALNTLYPDDIISVVAFDGAPSVVVEPQLNDNTTRTAMEIRQVQPGGGTSIYPALDKAVSLLAPMTTDDAAIRHIILLTDGQDGTTIQQYQSLLDRMAANGITMSTIGVGDMHYGGLLFDLATRAGGEYHPVQDPNNLPQVFIKEAQTLRRNLIKEEAFVPLLTGDFSPVTAGLSSLPGLDGLVLTGPRHDPRVRMPLVGAEGEPLFAHWQVGTGRSAAFTSDATTRWAASWVQWPGFTDFWTRTLRLIARPSASRSVELRNRFEGNDLVVELDAAGLSADDAALSGLLTVRGAVVGPDGEALPVELEQTSPGIYSTRLSASDTGNYLVYLDMAGSGGERRSVFGGATRALGEELRDLKSNDALVRQIAEITGGRVLSLNDPQAAGLFERTQPFVSRSMRPIWRELLALVIVLFLLDVANRRIAWDARAIAGWAKQKFTGLSAKAPSTEQTQSTMSALKGARQTAATKIQNAAEGQRPTPTPPTPSKKRKFEASPAFEASDDVAGSVGGASTQTITKSTRREETSAEAGEGAPSTNRLLAAKRRAQERMSQDED